MTWVMAWIFPFALFIGWLVERGDRRTDQARRDLEARQRMDKFDRAAAYLTATDPWAELDQAWCAELGIDWPTTAVGSLPFRPARHSSHNRLHRGF